MSRWVAVWVAAAAGCSVAAADHERLGDEAFLAGQFSGALTEYQAAARSGARPRVWAKVAAAALAAEDYLAAATAYATLGRDDPSRAVEAAVGLERVAREADRQGAAGLAAIGPAVLALREIAPGRPLGRLALTTASGDADPAATIGLLSGALAAAGTPRMVDSLLLRYADAQRGMAACEDAARSYRVVLRRTRDGRTRAAGQNGLAECALVLGQDALTARDGRRAEEWFTAVLGVETGSTRAWRAQLGLGDARQLQGDALGAAVAYQAVISGATVTDSLRGLATARLNGLGAATAEPPTDGEV